MSDSLIPKSKEVQIYDKDTKETRTFVIEEPVLSNRTKILRSFGGILTDIVRKRPDIANVTDSEAIRILIEVAGEERMAELYSSILGIDAEWVNKNLTIRKEIEVIMAFVEVNDIPFLLSQMRLVIPKDVLKRVPATSQ